MFRGLNFLILLILLNNIIPLNYDKFFKYHLIKLLGRFRKTTQILEI